MTLQRLSDLISTHASVCERSRSPFYGALLSKIAADVLADGPSAAVLAGHEDDLPGAATGLRLMGTVHRRVLSGDVPELAAHYPSTGGDGDAAAAWPIIRHLFQSDPLGIAAGLASPPQTNEVGRSAALIGALLIVMQDDPRPVRLWEIGCSAGLNLRSDHFRFRSADGHTWGLMSPVELDPAWDRLPAGGRVPVRFVERVGVDIAPIDPTTDDGALTLASYVWADQVERLQRLRSAILVAREFPATIVQARAGEYLQRLEPAEDTLTVLWHSVMWQYLPQDEQAAIARRIDEIGAAATNSAPFAHISFEPRVGNAGESIQHEVRVQVWPGGESRLVGMGAPHGLPMTWAR